MQAYMEAEDSIKRLVGKAQGGDRAAFGQLFDAHRQRLLERIQARMGRKLKQEHDPEDLAQETFLRAFETIGRFRLKGTDSFFHWLATIAEHLILNASQKRRPGPLTVEPRGSGVSPGTALRRKERFDRLEAALGALTPEQKKVVLLARIDGLSFEKIAAQTGKSQVAVRQLLARALKRLKKSMSPTRSLHLPDRSLSEEDPHRA